MSIPSGCFTGCVPSHISSVTSNSFSEGVLSSEPLATLGRIRGRGPPAEPVGGTRSEATKGSEDNTPAEISSAKRSMSRFRVWTKEGLISRKTGKTRFRILLRLKSLDALLLSSRQVSPCSRAKASMSSRVMPSNGRSREMWAKSESGRKPEAFIPTMPRSPVPRNKLRINVSALSLALCATATAE